ncbi:hypothetical protein ANN_03000 [Periplaneta americana]|uniref:Uncharacterized protein n=1 Tax=Periplaneta americana TaxID=6978 RepID=A0ABQ8U1J2_PERAM|nr:hypothetical protein ANN_03000 [Periplaneta americana]
MPNLESGHKGKNTGGVEFDPVLWIGLQRSSMGPRDTRRSLGGNLCEDKELDTVIVASASGSERTRGARVSVTPWQQPVFKCWQPPDLTPSYSHLFEPMKDGLRGQQHFPDKDAVNAAVTKWLASAGSDFYELGIQVLVQR